MAADQKKYLALFDILLELCDEKGGDEWQRKAIQEDDTTTTCEKLKRGVYQAHCTLPSLRSVTMNFHHSELRFGRCH